MTISQGNVSSCLDGGRSQPALDPEYGRDGTQAGAYTLGIRPPAMMQREPAFFEGVNAGLMFWPKIPPMPSGRTMRGLAYQLGVSVSRLKLSEIDNL